MARKSIEKDYMTVAQVARALNLSRFRIHQLIKAGHFEHEWAGPVIVIPVESFHAYLKVLRHKAARNVARLRVVKP